jgi:hypothetical protein
MRLLALTLLLPSLALAEPLPDATGAAPADEATWSIGAGIGYGYVPAYSTVAVRSGLLVVGGYVFSVPSMEGWVPSASMERRLAPRTWLVFGLTGLVSNNSYDPLPVGVAGPVQSDQQVLAVSAGVRQVFWSRSLFEVSGLGLAELGLSRTTYRYQSTAGAVAEVNGSAWTAGGSLGLAVDRELTSGLSVRLASPLLRVAWESGKATEVGTATYGSHGLQAAAVLEPRIELRLAF